MQGGGTHTHTRTHARTHARTHTHTGPGVTALGSLTDLIQQAASAPPKPTAVTPLPLLDTELTPGPFKWGYKGSSDTWEV